MNTLIHNKAVLTAFLICSGFWQGMGQPNLVTNGDFMLGNTGFNSEYSYCNTAGCLSSGGAEGKYAIGADPSFFHGGFSGAMEGNFMIVNGAGSPKMFWSSSLNVNPDAIYNFSFKLITVWPGQPGHIRFYINGVLAAEAESPVFGQGPVEVKGTWSSGDATTAQLAFDDLNYTLVGNDFGIDDIAFRLNQRPVALCKTIEVTLNEGGYANIEAIDLDNGSYDPEGGPLRFEAIKTSFNCSDAIAGVLCLCAKADALVVYDETGQAGVCTAYVRVLDITPPKVLTKNIEVLLDANGTANIVPSDVDRGSSDVCGEVQLSLSKSTFTCNDAGPQEVFLMAKDFSGNMAMASAMVTVKDNSAPLILSIVPDKPYLWPPNGKMIPVTLAVNSTDNCAAGLRCKITRVFSNEPLGKEPDWQITGATRLLLRAKRLGNGAGRQYTVVVSCTDAAGNISTGEAVVKVAHDQSPASGSPLSQYSGIKEMEGVQIAGNPALPGQSFMLKWAGNASEGPLQIRVMDMAGRLLETWNNLPSYQWVAFGAGLHAGTYLVEIRQGQTRKTLRLVKQ